jgi:hypothetical protein
MTVRHAAVLPLATLALFAVRPADAQSSPSGWTVAQQITIDSGGTSAPHTLSTRMQFTRDRMRMEGGFGDAPESVRGVYSIIDPTAGTTTVVMPSMRMVTITSSGSVSRPKGFTVDVADGAKSSIEDLGAGEQIFGHATHHFRVTMDYTMLITVGDDSCSQHVAGTVESWMTTDIDFIPEMLTSRRGLAGPATSAVAAKLKDLETGHKLAGYPIRMVMSTTTTHADGPPALVTTTSETTELTQSELDPYTFVAPADYRTMDMRNLTMPGGAMDAAMKTAGTTVGAMMKRALCGPTSSP